MSRIKLIITLLVIFLTCTALKAAEDDWKLIIEEDQIYVYTKPVKGSSFDEFKGVTIINARIEVIEMVLRDISSFHLWMSDCKESPIIEEIDKNNYILVYVHDLPWPLDDRETTMRAKASFDRKNGYYSVYLNSINDPRVPINDENVRMNMYGGFILEYMDVKRTKVTFFVKAYPGGSIPGIIANIFSKKIPIETLQGMKEMAKNQKYIFEAVKFLKKKSGEPAVED